jgi:hypothetical protein
MVSKVGMGAAPGMAGRIAGASPGGSQGAVHRIEADDFSVVEVVGQARGMAVRIAVGPRQDAERSVGLALHDHAFSFLEPILMRRIPDYHPDTRWGVRETAAKDWQPVVADLRGLHSRLSGGQLPALTDIAWVPAEDLDRGVLIDAGSFRAVFANPELHSALCCMLLKAGDWLETRIGRTDCLTIFGY